MGKLNLDENFKNKLTAIIGAHAPSKDINTLTTVGTVSKKINRPIITVSSTAIGAPKPPPPPPPPHPPHPPINNQVNNLPVINQTQEMQSMIQGFIQQQNSINSTKNDSLNSLFKFIISEHLTKYNNLKKKVSKLEKKYKNLLKKTPETKIKVNNLTINKDIKKLLMKEKYKRKDYRDKYNKNKLIENYKTKDFDSE